MKGPPRFWNFLRLCHPKFWTSVKLCCLLWASLCVIGGSFSVKAFSLFYLPDEVQKIQNSRPRKLGEGAEEAGLFHLSGLVYIKPGHWRLWMNGKPYILGAIPALQVLQVTPTSASFKMTSHGETVTFTLKPNQHYCRQCRKVKTGTPVRAACPHVTH